MSTAELPRLYDAQHALEALPGVRAVDVLEADARYDRPVMEVVVGPGYERVPPRVLRVLAAHDCGAADISTRGEPTHHVVLVT